MEEGGWVGEGGEGGRGISPSIEIVPITLVFPIPLNTMSVLSDTHKVATQLNKVLSPLHTNYFFFIFFYSILWQLTKNF